MNRPARGPTVRSVAVPAEHGGWGLTLEPGVLGVLLAPSAAGALLAVAAVLAFLLRTPLRLVLLRRSGPVERSATTSRQARVGLAKQVASVELLAIGLTLVGTAVLAADARWTWPLVVALPMLAVAFLYDLRSASRHIVPEVVGSIAVAGVAAMGTLAGGGSDALALGAWLILGARVSTSIPHVRAQVRRIHGRAAPRLPGIAGDLGASGAAVVAAIIEPALLLGAVGVAGLVIVQRITLARPPRPAKVLGVRQMLLGLGLVGLTALGAWLR
ncbi:MAG: YwiC-like family protein [Candidatus Limnocylindrales bacterium]